MMDREESLAARNAAIKLIPKVLRDMGLAIKAHYDDELWVVPKLREDMNPADDWEDGFGDEQVAGHIFLGMTNTCFSLCNRRHCIMEVRTDVLTENLVRIGVNLLRETAQ